MDAPLIISFYSRGTIYEREVEDLKASCQALKADHWIEGIEDQGSWQMNCCYKPLFILECLEKFKRPLLWVDADAILMQMPNWKIEKSDVAFYFTDFDKKIARSGTIYVEPTEEAKRFLISWRKSCLDAIAKTPDFPCGDQGQLPAALFQHADLKIGQLPVEWVFIFDRDVVPFEKVVILHSQASRTAMMHAMFWSQMSGLQLKKLRVDSSRSAGDDRPRRDSHY